MNKCMIAVDISEESIICVAYQLNREVLGQVVQKNKNDTILTLKEIKETIKKAIDELINVSRLTTSHELLCIYAGADALIIYDYKEELINYLNNVFCTNVRIENHMTTALSTVLKDRTTSGIIAISNLESICYGIKEDSVLVTGGWGKAIDDRGSAYHVITTILRSITNNYDDGNELSTTGKLVMLTLGISSLEELRKFSTSIYNVKNTIKSLNKLAIEGAKEIRDAFKVAGIELAKRAILLHSRLSMQEDITVGISGFVIRRSPYFQDAFVEEIKKHLPRANFDLSNTPRVMGAYYMFLKDLRLGLFS